MAVSVALAFGDFTVALGDFLVALAFGDFTAALGDFPVALAFGDFTHLPLDSDDSTWHTGISGILDDFLVFPTFDLGFCFNCLTHCNIKSRLDQAQIAKKYGLSPSTSGNCTDSGYCLNQAF